MPQHFVAPPEWGWYIVWYFFLGGIAGGAYVLGTLLRLRGDARDEPVARLAFLLSFPAMAICPVLLALDLGLPLRFWHMLVDPGRGALNFKYWSPMSLGSWVLLGFGLFCTVSFVATLSQAGLLGDALGKKLGSLQRLACSKSFLVTGSLFGLFLAGYTGVLLSVSNQPLWSDTWALGGLFLASAQSAAAAALLLLALWRRAGPTTIAKLHRADGWFRALELLLLVVFFASLGRVGVQFVQGPWLVLWLLVLACNLLPLARRLRGTAGTQAALLVLLGGLLLRIVVIFAPQVQA